MPPKFGTSGLRGLVVELTDELIGAHVVAFATNCPIGNGVFVGRDLRDSSPRIAGATVAALRNIGVDVTDCGDIATPALAMAAMDAGCAAVMVTGSHIPADRNGIKFYTPDGEITKAHEASIVEGIGRATVTKTPMGQVREHNAEPDFVARYVSGFGSHALSDKTVGVYSHSTVGRDMLRRVLEELGATVVELGRSETFIPVDTEAVDPDTRRQLIDWAADGRLDCIVSMDGDGDRPLLTDETGQVVPGDILGQITSKFLGAEQVVTPVSSNTGVDALGFVQVLRTKIGSPFVIAGMEESDGSVVGYEANGGFLLGFEAAGPNGSIAPLMTRDSVLPIVAVLVASSDRSVSDLVKAQPSRFTAADRLQEIPTERSRKLVASLISQPQDFAGSFGSDVSSIDQTDGLRMTLTDGRIVHIRPSGNAPELRVYIEADSPAVAQDTLKTGFVAIKKLVG